MPPADVLFRVAIGARMDAKLVHEYIVAFGLDPRPTKQHRPVRLRDKGWSILVETYEWGRVCVATNKHTTTVTWVEHGGIPEELPHWAAFARHRFDSPPCVGQHEPGDATCDGDDNEPACVWRSICRKVQTRAEAVRTTPERAITFMADDDAHEVPPSATQYRSAVPRPTPPPEDAQSKQVGGQDDESEEEPTPRGRVGSPHDPYVYSESRKLAVQMMESFARAIPVEYAGEYQHRCHAGGMFFRDKLKKSRHYTLYIRKDNATATPLAVMYLYPSMRRPFVKIQLVAPPEITELVRQALPQTLRVVQWKDGGLRPTIIDNIEERHVSQVSRVLSRLIREGHWPRITGSTE